MNKKTHIRYLGIYIDEQLNWETQIKHVSNKIAKNLGIILKLRYYTNLKTLNIPYYIIP